MNRQQIARFLQGTRPCPEPGTQQYVNWLECEDALEFLLRSEQGSVPVFITDKHFFLYSVFVRKERLGEEYVEVLSDWNLLPDEGWKYGTEMDEATGEPRKAIFPPFHDSSMPTLHGAEPLFFSRYFPGSPERTSYMEVNQRLAQLCDLHWLSSRAAYCKIDQNGDIHDVATIEYGADRTVCTVRRDELDFYMGLTDSVLVRFFDVTRYDEPESIPHANSRQVRRYADEQNNLYARRTDFERAGTVRASALRGFHMLNTDLADSDLIRMLRGEPSRPREYAIFVALDFKHGEVRECSCDPEQLGNYFVESDLPFETSPAFFRPEVLSKYQQDPDKYTVIQDEVRCRGAWSLRYDVSEEGQVHAYLMDLGRLPYGEQLYWKSFNEEPEGGIAERALRRDFLGEWYEGQDPAGSLLRTLEEFPSATHCGQQRAIWAPPQGMGQRLSSVLTYVVTESAKEWHDHVLDLAKLLVEGLDKRAIRSVARHLST